MLPPKDLKAQLNIPAKWTHTDKQHSVGLQEFLATNGFTTENLNQRNKEGWTPLTLAIFTGEGFVVHELVHNLVDVNKRNINGDTPLELALNQLEKNRGFDGAYRLLVDSGAKNNQGSIVKEGDIWRQVERYFQSGSKSEKGTAKTVTTPWNTQKDTDPLEVFIPGYLKTMQKKRDAKDAKDIKHTKDEAASIPEQSKKEPYYFLTPIPIFVHF